MDGIFAWMKNLIGCLCILELLYHMVQNSDYQKYLRFFGGIIFMILALQPILEMLHTGNLFEHAFRLALFQEEVKEMQETALALEELQNDKVQEAYVSELERQMETIVKWYGQEVVEMEISMAKKAGYPGQIQAVEITCREKSAELESIRTEIASLYGLSQKQILITAKE